MTLTNSWLPEIEIEKPKVLPSEFLRIGWIKNTLAHSQIERDNIEPNHPDADQWCALGAFCAALDIEDNLTLPKRIKEFLGDIYLLVDMGFSIYSRGDQYKEDGRNGYDAGLTEFNDTWAQSVEEVLEIVEAIELHLGWR